MRFVVCYILPLKADVNRLPTDHIELSNFPAFGLIDIIKAIDQVISRTRSLESMRSTI